MKGRIIKFITTRLGGINKSSFLDSFEIDWLLHGNEYPDLTIASYSGEIQFADQLYSIASFSRNVGIPKKWIIFSDGTHSIKSKEIFKKIPFAEFIEHNNDLIPESYKQESNPLLKKIFYYKSIKIHSTILFIDSDVLFYKSFSKFYPLLLKNNWFLVDEKYGYFDESYLVKDNFGAYPCNSGFFVFNSQPNWDIVMKYLDEQRKNPDGIQYWSEQTAFQILTRDFANYTPLDPRYFVVGGQDSFSFKSHFDYTEIALRHFVGPVRHKMWQYPWKKVLGIR
jgi:hypothetical protein